MYRAARDIGSKNIPKKIITAKKPIRPIPLNSESRIPEDAENSEKAAVIAMNWENHLEIYRLKPRETVPKINPSIAENPSTSPLVPLG